MLWLGVDVGGTFTDLVLTGADGSIVTHKVLSTPDDYGRAIVAAILDLAAQGRLQPESVAEVVHGTTVCSNAILEGKGARTVDTVYEQFTAAYVRLAHVCGGKPGLASICLWVNPCLNSLRLGEGVA